MCVICAKLTIKTPEQRQWLQSAVIIVNFEQISQVLAYDNNFEALSFLKFEKVYVWFICVMCILEKSSFSSVCN